MGDPWGSSKVRRMPDIRHMLIFACLFLILGSWVLVALQLEVDRQNIVRGTYRENANLAKAFEEHVRRTINEVDENLVIIKDEYERVGGVPPVINNIYKRVFSEQILNHMILFGADGNVITSAVKTLPDLNAADREYFSVHRGTSSGGLYIGKPVTDRILGKVSIPLSRRINKPDGSFDGVVAGLVSIDYFGNFYKQMELGDKNIIAVVGLDGIVRVRIINDQVSAGLDVSKGNLFQKIGQKPADSFTEIYTSDGQQRFVSYRVMPDHPLFVNVGTHLDQGLASYYQHRRWYWMLVLGFNLVVIWGGMLLFRKINHLLETQKEMAVSEDRYRTVFEAANDGIFIHDAKTGEILDVNEKACRFYGYTKEELLAGNLNVLGTGELPYTESEAKRWLTLAAAGEPQLFEWQNRHKQGSSLWMEVSLTLVKIGEAERIVAVVRDISVRKSHEEQIRRIAYYDTLTGLPNRAFIKESLELELEKAGRGQAAGAVMFVDLDDLKTVNDTFGHSCGDEVVIMAAGYISAASGAGSIVARLGGDEFIILMPGQHDRSNVSQLADKLVDMLGRNYEIAGSGVYMSASVGVAFYPADGTSLKDILKNADLALYAAKASGKNTWRFYDAAMEKDNREKLMLKDGLRRAIERNELSLQYQPILSTNRDGVNSFEALLRWNSSEFGAVSPVRFIPLAEESDTILQIGTWVLGEACRFARRLSDMGRRDIRVSINVSPRQLVAKDFVALVMNAVEKARIDPGQLGIEITENALIASLTDSTDKLWELRRSGVHLSIDDFGTGYSSLTYLRKLPVQTIKIDKSFIDEIQTDAAQLRFVRSIFSLAHVQGLTVVAEGVETSEQLDLLVNSKCDYIQGYIFSRPVPETDAIKYLADSNQT